jgi:hypothetical protein
MPEEQLEEGKVRKSGVAHILYRGVPVLHCAQPSALELRAEDATVEADLYLTGVSGGYRIGQPLFERRRHVAAEFREISHAHVIGVVAVAI